MSYIRLKTYPELWDGNTIRERFQKFGTISQVKNIKKKVGDKKVKFYRIDYESLTNIKGLFNYITEQNLQYDTDVENFYNQDGPDVKKSKNQNIVKENNQKNMRQNSIPNPSFHFYKDKAYGRGLEDLQFENAYDKLFSIDNSQTFELTTTYPGLLVGSGYNHPKLKENTNDFQLGFFFDHTTGLPLISGSSIKGLVRSVFPDKDDKYYKEKIEFLKEEYKYTFDENSIEEFFDNNANIIYYDAYIVSTKNKGKKIFGSDYITSHHSDEKNGEFKAPNPIKFLKILPEVTFKFQFKCTKQELNFFKTVILDFGLGAKTNVGYGKFTQE